MLTAAYVPRDKHLPRISESHCHEGEKGRNVAAHRDGGDARLAEDVAHDHHIHHIVYHLKEVRQKQRQGEKYQLLRNISFCKILNV